MSAGETLAPQWKLMQTDETRGVETRLREHFDEVDAYRYNSASIRVRVIDERFRGLTFEQRDDLVEPVLDELAPDTQAEIMTLVLLAPGEDSPSAQIMNLEFEHPSRSLL
jgi:hypothetical protein